jgi:hypothetical protein
MEARVAFLSSGFGVERCQASAYETQTYVLIGLLSKAIDVLTCAAR